MVLVTSANRPTLAAARAFRLMAFRRTRFDAPLCLYFLSACWAAGIAYQGAGAWRIFAFVCASLAIYRGLALMPSEANWRGTSVPLLSTVVGVSPALLAGYFILSQDWGQPVEKVAWLEPVRTWLAERQPPLGWPTLHQNAVGGILSMLLPLQVAAVAPRPSRAGSRSLGGLSLPLKAGLVSLSCAGLLLTGLRGAWLSLGVALALASWWKLSSRLARGRGEFARIAFWAGGVLAVVAALMATPAGAHLLALRPDRAEVWWNSWDLAWDYAFTGLGFGAFPMAYSSYVLLVHVPHTFHAHNLFLDIWLAQGLFGVVAFALLSLAALLGPARSASRPDRLEPDSASRWHGTAAVSLLVLLCHGLFDDAYLGYGAGGLLALFVPFALLARDGGGPRHASNWRPRAAPATVAAVLAVGTAAAALHPAVRAQVRANLGALSQTSVELARYRWPEWPLQDALRRSRAADLEGAVHWYRLALEGDAGNVTANRRLGQIELSLGRYEEAHRHLSAAFRNGPRQRATRQLLGESLAAGGDITGAAELWRDLPLEDGQLAIRTYWYESIHDTVRSGRITAAAALAHKDAGP